MSAAALRLRWRPWLLQSANHCEFASVGKTLIQKTLNFVKKKEVKITNSVANLRGGFTRRKADMPRYKNLHCVLNQKNIKKEESTL